MSAQEIRDCRSCGGKNVNHLLSEYRDRDEVTLGYVTWNTLKVYQCQGCKHLCTRLKECHEEDVIHLSRLQVDVEVLSSGTLSVQGISGSREVNFPPNEESDDFLLAGDLTEFNPNEADLSSGHEATYGWRHLTADYAGKLLSHLEAIHASASNNHLDIEYVRQACNLKKADNPKKEKNNIFFYKKVRNSIVAIAFGKVGVMDADKVLPLYIDVVLSSKGHGRPFVEHILRGHWEGFRVAYKGCKKLTITLDSIQNVIGFYEMCDMVQDGVADDPGLTRMSKTVRF